MPVASTTTHHAHSCSPLTDVVTLNVAVVSDVGFSGYDDKTSASDGATDGDEVGVAFPLCTDRDGLTVTVALAVCCCCC